MVNVGNSLCIGGIAGTRTGGNPKDRPVTAPVNTQGRAQNILPAAVQSKKGSIERKLLMPLILGF